MHETSTNYRIIEIPLNGEPAPSEIQAIGLLNKEIKPEDMFVELKDGGAIVYLNRINLSYLKEIQSRLNSPVIRRIIEAIEKIGSYGVKGNKRVFVDYNKERKVKDRKQKEKDRGKHFYAINNHFKKSENKLPPAFLNKIVCGDSEKILKKLPDNCIDLVFTSPPYNFGLEYDSHKDEHFWQEYFDKLFGIFKETIRVVKYGGRIVVNVQPLFSDYIPSHHIISDFFIRNKLIWKGEILWEKNNYNCKYTAWGSWKSPSNPYLKYTWEFLEVFCKGDLKKTGDREKIDITADEFKKWVVGKWSIAPEGEMKKFAHPAMFPEELARRVIKLFSYQDDMVLDPFNGVGTTTAVAKKYGRKYLGIEISPEYHQIALRRLKSVNYIQNLF